MTPSTYQGASALRAKLATGSSVGSFLSLPSAECAEILAHCGFDWLVLDTQHGLNDRASIAAAARAVGPASVPLVVRVPALDSDLAGWCIDAGAGGVMFPLVNTAKDVAAGIAATRYAPGGVRSWGPVRATMRGLGFPPDDERPVIFAMIETQEGLENIEEIAAVDGVDLIFVGQSDLALAYGLRPGLGIADSAHVERLRRIVRACDAQGVACAVNCQNPGQIEALRAAGFRHMAMMGDVALLRAAGLQAVSLGRPA